VKTPLRENKSIIVSLYAFGVIAASILFWLLLNNFGAIGSAFSFLTEILSPFLYALVIAYLLNPVMIFAERVLFNFKNSKKDRKSIRRILSLVFAYIVGALIIAVFLVAIIPQLTKSVETLIENFNSYSANIEQFSESLLERFGGISSVFGEGIESFGDIIDQLLLVIKDSLPLIMNTMKQGVIEVKNFFLGLIISIYLLSGKEKLLSQLKKLLCALLPKNFFSHLLKVATFTHETISDFIVGKILDSAIVGILCFISMSILRLEYALLISFVVGITNVIPYFGPFIGAIPSIIILLIVEPMDGLWFAILILILQQLDGNVIGPKILGESLGLSSFWIIFAIIVMSGFFGLWGMFLGVPIFAVIYNLVSGFINERLTDKKLPTQTSYYANYKGKDAQQ